MALATRMMTEGKYRQWLQELEALDEKHERTTANRVVSSMHLKGVKQRTFKEEELVLAVK